MSLYFRITLIAFCILSIHAPFSTAAQVIDEEQPTAAYTTMFVVKPDTLKVPTVVAIPIELNAFERPSFLVHDDTSNLFIPSLLVQSAWQPQNRMFVFHAGGIDGDRENDAQLSDKDYGTFTDFPVNGFSAESESLEITIEKPMSVSGVQISLGNYVALPNTVSVKAGRIGAERIVLAEEQMSSGTVRFPSVTDTRFVITLSHNQPLRLSEITLISDAPTSTVKNFLRFLAQPDHIYTVYANPDRYVDVSFSETPDLRDNRDVLQLSAPIMTLNNAYIEADGDGDSIPDMRDNCVNVSNATQVDDDMNGRGDACDDFDKDGIINVQDNCVNDPNASQVDTDDDGKGDTCDGIESRLTESYPYIPWIALGLVALLVAGMLYSVIHRNTGGGQITQ